MSGVQFRRLLKAGLWLSLAGRCVWAQQTVIPLAIEPSSRAPASADSEKAYFSKNWNAPVVTNVTKPSLTVFKPAKANGTGIVVCPGGGFMALSIQNEGTQVAEWLTAHGVTAFVLKYRLAHTDGDATEEFQQLFLGDKKQFERLVAPVIPLSIADGRAAVEYVHKHAEELGLDPQRVGIVGFSAGGTVTAGTALKYSPEGRPAFVASIYAATQLFKGMPVPTDAAPLFVAAASDDSLGLANDSVLLYDKWIDAHKSAELHMYAKGGHGFGMHKQHLPSDEWIDRFGDWLASQGWLTKQ